MASSEPFYTVNLTENEVPGAKLIYKDIEKHSKLQLQRFLACRNLRSLGSKSELVARAKEAIERRTKIWNSIDNGKWVTAKQNNVRRMQLSNCLQRPPSFPIVWNKFSTNPIPKMFCYGTLFQYLVNSCVVPAVNEEHENSVSSDEESVKENEVQDRNCGISKPLKRGQQFFDSGHVTDMEDAMRQGHYSVRANVRASYKNERYKVMVMLNSHGDVVDAHCICKASAMGRCSHVAAVLLALNDFANNVACTSKPCTWNRGRRQGKTPDVVNKNYNDKINHAKKISFDPRAHHSQSTEEKDMVVTEFASSLCQNKISSWELLLRPRYEEYMLDPERKNILKLLVCQLKDNVTFGANEPICITDSQSEDEKWHNIRKVLITASRVKEYHPQKTCEQFSNLVDRHLYGNNIINSPFLAYGRENEKNALNDYLKFKMEEVGSTFSATETGLWINPNYAGIGASPDALVFDISDTHPHGLLEIKCPKLLERTVPNDLDVLTKEQKARFCCTVDDEKNLKLKSTHKYFAQVQTQMGVTGRKWCDFAVWTPSGISIQRIAFQESAFLQLMSNALFFFDNVLAPEYFEQRIPRKLKPFNLDEC